MTTTISGAEAMVRMLQLHGVQHIFGLCGDTSLPFYDALYRLDHGMQHILARDERSAAYMADVYARITGRVGVCVVTSGPGATNTITAIADAHRDNVPLIVITGQVPTAARNTDAFQETNIVEIAAPTAKKVYYLNRTEDMPVVLHEAFRLSVGQAWPKVLLEWPRHETTPELMQAA